MKVDVREVKELVHELSVEIPADVVNGELEQAFADVRRRATLKGFRKGKAPLNLVKARYGEDVRADVADQLIRSSFPRAVKEKQLKVASVPTVTDSKFEDNGIFRYTATVEVLPGIEKADIDNLEVIGVELKVEDKDVDAMAENVRKLFADLREVSREVQAGDVVVADLKKLYDPNLVLEQELMSDVEIDLDRA